MNLAIIHHHLRHGGVTQVIANQLSALDAVYNGNEHFRVAVIHSGECDGWPEQRLSKLKALDIALIAVPELRQEGKFAQKAALGVKLHSILTEHGFSPDRTIVHAHNHALGTNALLPEALYSLAQEGYRLLLHIHDFPEDLRPAVYQRLVAALCPHTPRDLPSILYPQAGHVHYAVLNCRDQGILQRAGVVEERLHALPNAIPDIPQPPSRESVRAKLAERFGIPLDGHFILSPVRCIRRKNIGEALLLSALTSKNTWFGFTLPPLDSQDEPSYERWKKLARTLKLQCLFEIGSPAGFGLSELLAAADALLTTSVAEGFGMIFLESWLAGLPLIGRDIPEITSDYVTAGIDMRTLQPRLSVPIDWIGESVFQKRYVSVFRDTCEQYRQPVPSMEELQRFVDTLIENGRVDFGVLDETQQQHVLRMVCAKMHSRTRLHTLNPWLRDALSLNAESISRTIQRNAEVVRQQYSLEMYGHRLWKLYQTMFQHSQSDRLEPLLHSERILATFLNPLHFHPIRIAVPKE